MIREVKIKQNDFLALLADSLILYEAATNSREPELVNALSKASVLSSCYALEAAANSFLESVEVSSDLKNKIDRFITLQKFDFVLQWHTGKALPKGCLETQQVKELIDGRNSMVHPSIVTERQQVRTEPGDENFSAYHYTMADDEKKVGSAKKFNFDFSNLKIADAKEAVLRVVKFLNCLVIEWWGITHDDAALLLFQTWDGSIRAQPLMFERHQIEVLLRHNEFLQIKFIGIYGLLGGESL
ncbi:hypothetical protein D9M69_449090 [compost metagenome]